MTLICSASESVHLAEDGGLQINSGLCTRCARLLVGGGLVKPQG